MFNYSGPITGTQTVVATVNPPTVFEGVTATELVAVTTGTNTVSGVTAPIDTEVRNYSNAAADGRTTEYGATGRTRVSVAGFTIDTTFKTVFTPAWIDARFAMNAGETLVQTYTGTTTSTTPGLFGAPATNTTNTATTSTTIRFLGIESVSVPAGSFNSCKFEEYETGTPANKSTIWFGVGNGAVLKTVTVTPEGTQTIEATSLVLNGSSL